MSNSRAKTKLGTLAFLYFGQFMKTSNSTEFFLRWSCVSFVNEIVQLIIFVLTYITVFYSLLQKSGTSNAFWGLLTPEQIQITTEQTASLTGCPNDNTLLQCLREVPVEDLAIADGFTVIVGPVVDGSTLLDDPLTLIASGQVQRKDSIIGNSI